MGVAAARAQADAVQAAIACIGQDGLLGLHIEGPHIAQARRGTHASEFIRPMDERTLDDLMKLQLEERWRIMLAEVDELMDELQEEEKQDRAAG